MITIGRMQYTMINFPIYLMSCAIREGASEAIPLLKKLVSDFEKTEDFQNLEKLDTVQLSSYIKAEHHLNKLSGKKQDSLIKLALILISRQRIDGGFPAAPLYKAAYKYYYG